MPSNSTSVRRMRSALYVPGHRQDFLDKVGRAGVDGIIIDLEDSVPPQVRNQARQTVARWLALQGSNPHIICLRINGLDRDCLEEDLAAAVCPALAAIQIPKVQTAEDVLNVEEALARHEARQGLPPLKIRIWPLLETALAVHDAFEIALASKRIAYMGAGASADGDLARDVGFKSAGSFTATLYILSKVLLDVRAAGIANPMGFMPTKSIGDISVQVEHARFLRSLGYEGVSMIHPSQAAVANEAFGVTDEEVASARELVRAMEVGIGEGKGAILHKGAMVDKAHLETARLILSKAKEFESRHATDIPG